MGLVLLSGCVPYPLYLEQQKKLSASYGERNEEAKKLATCEERVRGLKETIKDVKDAAKQQRGTTIIMPGGVKIDQKELDEMKKKALIEAERKSKASPVPGR